METQQYTNYAFISYKREDEKWAKWLQKKLESYKLPSIVREQRSDLPKYLRPIFRDGTDLSGGILVDQLRRELLQSRYLIVICSPNATKSEWINREAQTFIDEGRIGQIVPFIVGGTPHASNPADECFPQSLRDIPSDKELLGINVQEVGKDMAFIRLVATMIGVRFDTLWQRHRRDLIRRRIAYGCAAALFCLLGLFAWDYNRATYEYFADWVDCYGVPEGILPLTDEQVSHRRRSYQFEYRRIPFGEPNAYSWRVAKVSYVNSAKRPQDIGHTELKDRYPIQEMEYNKQTGVVSRINFYDTKGKVLLRHVLTERDGVAAAVADFVDAQEQRGTGFIGADLSSMRLGQMDAGQQKSNIVRFVYERDEKGHIVKQTYHANNDYQLRRSAISDADGIFGRRFSLDSLGRRIKVDYLGLEGELACTKKGIAGRLYEYDEHGEISKTTYVNQKGMPTLNELMFSICVANSDEWGNTIEEFYYGTDIQPSLRNNGYAKVSKYDDRGNEIERAFFGTDGQPCLSNEGIAKWVSKYDDRGNVIECTYFGTDGQPCLISYGHAKRVSKYDDRGNEIECAYFGTDGQPCLSNEGIAKWVSKYDDRENEIECAFLGTDGQPCLHKDGYAKWVSKYDDRGNRIEEAYFGTDGQPCLHKDGLAKLVSKYDDRGNLIECAFFGTDGQPCLHKDGNAKWVRKYDDRGNEIERAYFGTDGQPCLHKDGYAKWVRKYDDRGNMIEEAYFGTDGQPCLSNEGFAKLVCKYDDRGNQIEYAFFGTDGQPCLSNEGIAKWVSKYDDRGNMIESAFFGTDGQPCLSNEGIAKWVSMYDDSGNMIECAYFGTDGQPCLSKDGFAKWVSMYDGRGNEIECAYFGTDGQPCLSNNGCAKWVRKYDDRGNEIEQAYFGTSGQPCLINRGYAKLVCKYDDRGNQIEYAFFGTDGHPCLISYGYAKLVCMYDDRGNLIEQAYFGTDGQPCLNSYGCAKLVSKYDDRGNEIERAFWDINDEPIEAMGYHRMEVNYDDRHHRTDVTYYNKENQSSAQQISSEIIDYVRGIAQQAGLPVQSILLQWNDWKLGDAVDALSLEHDISRYGKKNLYYMTPDGDIMHIYVERGLVGIGYQNYNIEKTQAEEWMKKLEAWKKEHPKE